jgi:hypothetical protein
MNWKLGGLITVAAIILIFVAMFYSGMFMHGD